MTEPIIRRVPCLSDGAMASLREDLAEAKEGEPMVLAWNYVSKALEEIDWLRAREVDREASIACGFCGAKQSEAKKLVCGTSAYICDECIPKCWALIMPTGGLRLVGDRKDGGSDG